MNHEKDSQIAAIVLLRADGAALLQHRDDIPTIRDPNIWVMPGGHLEPGEAPLAGGLREFEEETAYVCLRPRELGIWTSLQLGYTDSFTVHFYWDDYDGRQAVECREGQALRFVGRDEINTLPRRDYLTVIWDLALAARDGSNPSFPS